MKAYEWQDEGMDRGYIVYAEDADKAREKVAYSKYLKYTDVQVKRTPWLDEYYGKDIPAKVMLEHGWWVMCDCCECECALDNDTAYIKDGKAYCIDCDAELGFCGDLD